MGWATSAVTSEVMREVTGWMMSMATDGMMGVIACGRFSLFSP